MFTSVDFERLRKVKGLALKSVVTILRYSPESKKVIDFGAGFVLYVDVESKSIVAITSTEVLADSSPDEVILVRFGNGTLSKASVLVDDATAILVGLHCGDADRYCRAAVLSNDQIERGQMIVTFATVWDEFIDIGMYTGSVIHPSCMSVTAITREPVDECKKLFAFSCPVAGPLLAVKEDATFQRLIGAPVFNLKGHVVGITDRCSKYSYDLKYARISSYVPEELFRLFGTDGWQEKVQGLIRKKNWKTTSS